MLHRARRQVEDLERRYMAVDPENRLVAAGVEAQLEHAKRELLTREAAAQRAPSRCERPVAADLRELEDLAKDVKRLFEAPTTTNRDRKKMSRAIPKTANGFLKWEMAEANAGSPMASRSDRPIGARLASLVA